MPQDAKAKRAVPLTVFLLKDGIREIEALAEDKAEDLLSVSVEPNGKALGTLYVKPSYKVKPQWLKFFGDSIRTEDVNLWNQSTSAVLFVRSRWVSR